MNIHLNRIHKSYREGRTTHGILEDSSATFPANRFSLILGKSGSGKSTVLNLIGGIDTPDSGTIHFDELNVTSLPDRKRTLLRRRKIGFVFQFFNLIPTLSVLENVCLVGDLDGKPRKRVLSQAREVLGQVGLLDRLHARPDILSGGEQQRVAIARALAHDPELILADEPTGNLDGDTGLEVLELLGTLAKTKRKTLIMVTHSSDAFAFADCCFLLKNRQLAPKSDSNLPGLL